MTSLEELKCLLLNYMLQTDNENDNYLNQMFALALDLEFTTTDCAVLRYDWWGCP